MKILSLFEHLRVRNISKIRWENFAIPRKVLGPKVYSLEEALNLSRLTWLGDVLRMLIEHPSRALFPETVRD